MLLTLTETHDGTPTRPTTLEMHSSPRFVALDVRGSHGLASSIVVQRDPESGRLEVLVFQGDPEHVTPSRFVMGEGV
jgi:hypothetical protein